MRIEGKCHFALLTGVIPDAANIRVMLDPFSPAAYPTIAARPDRPVAAGARRAAGLRRRGHFTPLVVAGDFNASQDHAAFRRILDTGLHDAARLDGHDRTPSWPARTASAFGVQIGHVLLSGDFSVRAARFLGLTGTDHRALVAELTRHQRR